MNRWMRLPVPNLTTFFLVLVVLELILAGSGRMVEIGSITLRMILFIICTVSSLIVISIRLKINPTHGILILSFTFSSAVGVMVGIFHDAPLSLILEDIKPLSYFFMLLFFYLSINSYERVKLVAWLFKFSALILLVSYLGVLGLLKFGLIDFTTFYFRTSETGEFFFRGTDGFFFYKGFLFLCVGFFFFWIDGNKWSKLIALALLGGIVLTFTRGFIVAVGISFLLYLLSKSRKNAALLLVIAASIPLFIWGFSTAGSARTDIDVSTQMRFTTLDEVLSSVTFWSIWVGNGFGVGVPSRVVHMEISYLEIFHKQGMLGLLFWGLLFFFLAERFVKCLHRPTQRLANAFFWSSLMVVIQSFTNPFINNSIGMSVILISLVSLNILAQPTDLAHKNTVNTLGKRKKIRIPFMPPRIQGTVP